MNFRHARLLLKYIVLETYGFGKEKSDLYTPSYEIKMGIKCDSSSLLK